MTITDHALPIGTNDVTTGEWIEVRCAVRRRAARARARVRRRARSTRGRGGRAPRTRPARSPAWKRAEILDTAARLLVGTGRDVRPHHRDRGGEADQDRTRRGAARGLDVHVRGGRPRARSPARWSRWTPSAAGEGKLAFTLRVPIGVVGAISPFNFPLNLVAHKLAPAIAAGCPVVLKPASQTPLSAIALARLLLDECGLPRRAPQRRDRRRRHGRQRHRRPRRHRDDHVHRVARGRLGHPGAGAAEEGRARARQQRAGDHRADGRLSRPRPRRSRSPASATPGQSCISTQRVYVHAVGRATSSSTRSCRSSKALRRRRPARREAPTCRRSSPPGSATVCSRGSRRPSAGRRRGRSRAARCAKTACSRPPCSATSRPT